MLHFIKGTLAEKEPGYVVIDNNGIGYEIFVPDSSPVYLLSEGERATLYVSMIVREDDVTLYGFSDKEGLSLFKKLITVSGVGAKAAIAILSVANSSEIKRAIYFEDVDFLTRASGVGKKTAQRIVLELRDKVGDMSKVSNSAEGTLAPSGGIGSDRSARNEAVTALIALGYTKAEAADAIARVPEGDYTSEEYIKKALKELF